MYKFILTTHILAAAIWTGGHLVLTLGFLPKALRSKNHDIINQFESKFEVIGIPSLIIQIITGIWLTFHYLPKISMWFTFDNHISTHISVKWILLLFTLALAIHARLRLIPRLSGDNLVFLAIHIIAVTTLSVLFVIVGVGIRTGGIF